MTFSLSRLDWHKRFQEQAGWTSGVRRYLYEKINLQKAHQILEVGCGTGVISQDLHKHTNARVIGVDVDLDRLIYARDFDEKGNFCNANGFSLPFSDQIFDVTLCHYYLLWVHPPDEAVKEMKRVTRLDGYVAVLAEPDYRHRIDYPLDLEKIASLQSKSLFQQGADPHIGARIPQIMHDSGFKEVMYGLPGGEWVSGSITPSGSTELEVLKNDLFHLASKKEIDHLLTVEREAKQSGIRVLFVPTFYAIGQV